jgi:hypothetical protein
LVLCFTGAAISVLAASAAGAGASAATAEKETAAKATTIIVDNNLFILESSK